MSANWIRAGATAVALMLILDGGSSVRAVQATQLPPQQAPAQAPERLTMFVGRSLSIDLTYDMERLSITDPEIADAIPVTQREILVHGKKAGTVSLIVWGGGPPCRVRVGRQPRV
jgi:Flp pilus assembly secretin CpaC